MLFNADLRLRAKVSEVPVYRGGHALIPVNVWEAVDLNSQEGSNTDLVNHLMSTTKITYEGGSPCLSLGDEFYAYIQSFNGSSSTQEALVIEAIEEGRVVRKHVGDKIS